MSHLESDPNNIAHMNNMEEIALADLELHKEALQYNLILLHRSVMISLLALMVAIVAVVVAIKVK